MLDLSQKQRDRDYANLDSTLNVMFLAVFPLLLWAFSGTFAGVATSLLVIWLFSVALRLIGKGQRVQRVYETAIVAKRPKFPRKILGSALIGVVALILAGYQFTNLLFPVLTSLVALALSLLAFGLDPLTDKGVSEPHLSRQMETADALESIEAQLDRVIHRINDLNDPELSRQTETACDIVISMLRRSVQDLNAFRQTLAPANAFSAELRDEMERLHSAWEQDGTVFARNRFAMKLEILIEHFTQSAQHLSQGMHAKDRFSHKAERLFSQIPAESVA